MRRDLEIPIAIRSIDALAYERGVVPAADTVVAAASSFSAWCSKSARVPWEALTTPKHLEEWCMPDVEHVLALE